MPHSPLRLQILSDLHLGNTPFPLPHTNADIVVLAGDISRPKQALHWASGFTQPVLYVAGNHEFYGSSIEKTLSQFKQQTQDTSIHFLEKESRIINGVRFLGTSLWTDFNLLDPQYQRQEMIQKSLELIRDFSMIRSDSTTNRAFSPSDMEQLFAQNRQWLQTELAKPFNGHTVVITHHAPSTRSIHPRFSNSPLNACFVSNSEHLLRGDRVQLWIHGHTHNSFDYQVNGTRVVCNPRGYVHNGTLENPDFNPGLIITL